MTWSEEAVKAAADAHEKRLWTFAGTIVHPETYKDMMKWAMQEALVAAAKVEGPLYQVVKGVAISPHEALIWSQLLDRGKLTEVKEGPV